MKYFININQLALSKIAPSLDITDAAILDYIIHFCITKNTKVARMTFTEGGESKRFTWINYSQLIRELPILKIKSKSAISKRIDKIQKAGFIKIRQEFGTKGRLFVRLTEKISGLFFEDCSFKRTTVRLGEQEVFVQTNIQHNIKRNNILSAKADSTLSSGKSKKDPRIKEIIDFFYKACQGIKNFKPVITGSVDGSIIKKRLKNYSLEEIEAEMDWFLKSDFSDKLGCTIKVALSGWVFNKWLSERAEY